MGIVKKMLSGKNDKAKSKKSLELRDKIKTDLKNYREQFDKPQKEEREAYHGVIWKNQTQYKPYENFIFEIIEGEVPILTDSLPKPVLKTNEPALKEQVENLDAAVDWVLKDQSFELMFSMVVRNELIDGTGYIHTYYDANADNGQGKIINELLRWDQVYLSGRTQSIEDCDKAEIELDRSKDWLELNYPNFKDKIKKLKSDDAMDSTDPNRGREQHDTNQGPQKRSVPKKYKDDDTLILRKTYKVDYSLEKISEEDSTQELEAEAETLGEGMTPDLNKWQDHKFHMNQHQQELFELYGQLEVDPSVGYEGAADAVDQLAEENPESGEEFGLILRQIKLLETHLAEHDELAKENPEGGKLKYPGGFRVIESVQSVLLYDGPIKDRHQSIPITPFYCYRNGTIYGASEIRNIIDSQRMQAVVGYKEYKAIQRTLNKQVVIDEETGLDENAYSNEDGAVYVIPQGTSIRHVDSGPIAPQLGQFQDKKIENARRISGITDETQGVDIHPNSSGFKVDKIQQQSKGRIRLKSRQNSIYSMSRLGKLIGFNIIQYWTSEKVLGLEDEGAEAEQIMFNPITEEEFSFEVGVAEGTMAGVDKDAFNAIMLQAVQAGYISFSDFLEVADLPKQDKLKELVKLREDTEGQIAGLQEEIVKLKMQYAPQSLSPEEEEQAEQIALDNEQAGGNNNEQV